MDGISVLATVVSTIGGIFLIFFGFYRQGLKPQLGTLHDKIDDIKSAVEENTITLNHHGERLATLENDVKWLKNDRGGGDDAD